MPTVQRSLSPAYPIRLKKGADEAVRKGMPWVYAGDIVDSSEPLLHPPGSFVTIETAKGQFVGLGYCNPRSQIAVRVLSLEREAIDAEFFRRRFEKALAVRDKLVGVPYYRLVHSEADGLPGLLVDRFGQTLVVQVGTAGMEALQPLWLEALTGLLKPDSVVFRNDNAARGLEGLGKEVRVTPSPGRGEGGVGVSLEGLPGKPPPRPSPQLGEGEVELLENGCYYYADLVRGQKTGWFFDQRDNRAMIAQLAAGKTLIDIYAHSGGFGILAAKNGAQVTLVDSSKLALELAQKAAGRNGVQCAMRQGDAFEVMEALIGEGRRYDIVLADPPAFVKSKKDIASGLKGYAKVARLAAQLVAPGGMLFMASCSHHAGRSAFNKAVLDGVAKAGRRAEIVKQTGAAADHPRHPSLPQNEYLKGVLLVMQA